MSATTISLIGNRGPGEQLLDDYVRRHRQGSAYHLAAWRHAVEQAYGYPGMAVCARGAGDEVVGLLPLCAVKLPFGRPRWVSLPFCDLGGPLADSPEIAEALVARARAELDGARATRLDLRCSAPQPVDDAGLEGRKVRMVLEGLPASAEALLASYSPKLRSQIRKAEKNGLSFAVVREHAAIADFYDVYHRNMRRLGSPPHSRRWFEAIHQSYSASGEVVLGLVSHQDKVVGAGLVLKCGTKAVIPWASTLAEYNPLAPNMLLYWGIQAHLCNSGVTQFDFGRSTYGEGTFKFKKQWGAQPVPLDWQQWTAQGRCPVDESPAKAGGGIRPLVEAAWSRLPLAVATGLGARVRRYITL